MLIICEKEVILILTNHSLKKETYIIDGEAIITDEDFSEVNKDGEYKNSRNLAAGTLAVLDTSLVAKRKLKFYVDHGSGYKCKDDKENE